MKVLCVDTTTDRIVLALFADGNKYYFIGEKGCKKHNAVLLEEIDTILRENGVDVNEIDYFGVCIGPGSFTGIRIGVATINAFALALGRSVAEVTSLEIEDDGTDKLVLLSCGHGNYYVGRFGEKTEYFDLSGEELDKIDMEKVFIEEIDAEKFLNKVLTKISDEQFVEQARPFYLKKSSAERNE